MTERLYLDHKHLGFLRKSKEQTGEQQGGKYSARIQTGIEKDGSPQYRYFTSQAEYEDYLSKQRSSGDSKEGGKGKKKDESMKERLQSKLKKEQKESSTNAKDTSSKKLSGQHSRNRSLYAGSTASVKKYSVKKGLTLYLGATNE